AQYARTIARHAQNSHFLVFKVRHEIKNPLSHLRTAERLQKHVNDLVARLLGEQRVTEPSRDVDKRLSKINGMFALIIFATDRISDCVELLRDKPEAKLQLEICQIEPCLKVAAWIAATEYLGLDRIIKIDCDCNHTFACFRVRLIRALI